MSEAPSDLRDSLLDGPWLVVVCAAIAHLTLAPRVADLDSFYHMGHAAAYLEGSLFDTALPWATHSIIGRIGGDLWWGFHVLLTPFAALFDVADAIRVAAFLGTLVLGGTVWWALRRHETRAPGVWAALFLLVSPNLLFRELMLRPHVLSLALGIALLSCLVRGRWWQVALLAALTSWIHLSLFWLPAGIACAYGVARIPVTVLAGREHPDTGLAIRVAVPSAALGALLGWLARPDALAAASLLNTQLLQLFTQKAAGLPLTFAAELSPVGPWELLRTTWLFAAAWGVGIILFARHAVVDGLDTLRQSRGTFLVAALLISVAFLFLSLVSARRAMEQWAAFGFLILPFLATVLEPPKRPVRLALGFLLAIHLAWTGWRHSLNVALVAFPGDSLREAAEYLADASEPGDLVFHARWDNFGPLFAFNRVNRYLGGMDPIFQYAADPRAFWEFFYLSTDSTNEWTCDAYPCVDGTATDTHLVLRDHFGARWVVVEPRRNPRLSLYLLEDDRFRLALETQHEAVFEVLPGS